MENDALQTMGIMMMSLVVGKVIITLIIDGLFQGKLSNLIIGILMKMNLSQAEADVIYQNVFRANRDVFQWIGFMLCCFWSDIMRHCQRLLII